MSIQIEAAPPSSVSPGVLAKQTLSKGVSYLLSLQNDPGYWVAELETNVTMEAEDLMLRRFLGLSNPETTRRTAAWIRSKQLRDGVWNIFFEGPADLSATVEAYVALRLAGDPADAAHMERAARRVREMGGLESSRVFTRFWLALFGQWSWDELPALPPEVILLPAWFPLNIYDFGCWARQTIVPLTIVAAHRPCRSLGFDLDELRAGKRRAVRKPLTTWAGRFQLLDRVLHRYDKRPLGALRRHALRIAAEWIIRRQEADGSWGGIQPPWVYSLMALHLLGYPINHPVMKKGIEGLDAFTISEGGVRRFEACQSPVWDTCLASLALTAAGLPADHPALLRAADWMLGEEIRVQGDWAVRRPGLAPGGWAFEYENDNYPDIDDTAMVVMALRRTRHPDARRVDEAIARAVRWTLGLQCSDGGWAAFDVDNTRELCAELPFCDFGEVIDPPSADVTGHVLEMLAGEGLAEDSRVKRGRDWLLRAQEQDGSWSGRWGANYVYGTGSAVPGLIASGVSQNAPEIRRAVRWLEAHQNDDGGWGEDLRSYEDPTMRGRGASTASQTAWALLALVAACERGESVDRGVAWLAHTQLDDGSWEELHFTGTGFPRDFYIRYHLYRQVFPVLALGSFLRGKT
jgi:squalene-hopene/tetraprenyl-beta-curcumene cyclase